jgi:L-asparaginase
MKGRNTEKIIAHGGIGIIEGNLENKIKIRKALIEIVENTYPILLNKGPYEAVLYGIRLLEDNPLFNAGTGSRLQSDGKIRMSASFMSSKTLKFSGVINIQDVEHPIDVAEKLQQNDCRVLAGGEATSFARENGFPKYNPITDFRFNEYKSKCYGKTGTVGIVAIDSESHIVVGTSTGGKGCELPGRVSDSPTVAGNYLSKNAGISTTGIGEDIVDAAVASRIVTMVDSGMTIDDATETVLKNSRNKKHEYGIIGIDLNGNIVADQTSGELYYAYHSGEEIFHF